MYIRMLVTETLNLGIYVYIFNPFLNSIHINIILPYDLRLNLLQSYDLT